MTSLVIILTLIVEVFFYAYLRYIVAPRLNQYTTPPRAGNYAWNHFLKTLDALDNVVDMYAFEDFIRGWFDQCEFEEIRKGNAREFLLWCMYHEEMKTASLSQKEAVGSVLESLLKRYEVTMEEGFNPEVKANRYTKDKVEYLHRPLLFYVLITGVQLFGHVVLQLLGFVRHEVHGIAYWYKSNALNKQKDDALGSNLTAKINSKSPTRNFKSNVHHSHSSNPSATRASLPLLFFHGISPGLNIYLVLLHILSREREVVLVEVPHICMNLGFRAKSCMDMVKAVETITKRHNLPYLAVAGHSFGSLCASWVVRHLPDITAQLILLDPVCILLTFPDIAYNFLYRKPKTVMEWILYLFGSKEITIQHALRRHFWWYEGSLFLDEVECPVFLGLAGKDEIVPSQAIKHYIDKYLDQNSYADNDREENSNSNSSEGNSSNSILSNLLNKERVGSVSIEIEYGKKETIPLGRNGIEQQQVQQWEEESSLFGKKNPLTTVAAPMSINISDTSTYKISDRPPKNIVSFMRRRVRYHFWPKNSHGDILFAIKYIKKLDEAIRDQEQYCIDINKRKLLI